MNDALLPVRHDYVDVSGLRTHLLRSSSQIDTLFLHGVGGSSWTFAQTISHLEGEVAWASADLLGYGESSWLTDNAGYTTATQAEQIAQVLASLGTSTVNLVGFSWGGLIALEVAARSALVERLVVIDIPPATELPATAVPPIPWSYPDVNAAIETMGRLAPRATREVLERDALLSTCFGPDGLRRKLDPRLLERFAFRDENHWETWEQNSCDTLLVRGAESPVLSTADATDMMRRSSSASFVEIEAAGHLVPLEQPRRLASVLTEFLN